MACIVFVYNNTEKLPEKFRLMTLDVAEEDVPKILEDLDLVLSIRRPTISISDGVMPVVYPPGTNGVSTWVRIKDKNLHENYVRIDDLRRIEVRT